jgi:amidase
VLLGEVTPWENESAMPLAGETAAALAALVRHGEVTPVEIIRAHLTQIAAHDPHVGAFQSVRGEKALAEAAALSARTDLRGLPLAGVPIAIKDNVPVAGEPMRMGSLAMPDDPRPADHETVRRLRAAGAIVVGTTRVPELCVWGTTDSAFGVTRNPWNLERTSGGSSGGSAAAVAAAMVPVALGADGLGSIRIPAASCGVVGFKPGTGLVPADLGVSSWYGLAENGPLATTVDDVALMLSVLANRADLCAVAPPNRALRIAVSTRSPVISVGVAPSFASATLDIARLLAGAGHTIEPADPPMASPRDVAAVFAHWFGGTAQDAEGLALARLEPRTRRHVGLGRIAQRVGLVRPQDRDRWRRRQEKFFARFDALLTPMLGRPPIRCDAWSRRSWSANVIANVRFGAFAGGWNFAGYPAMAVPAGVNDDGTPLSVQLVAASTGETIILSLAKQVERLRPWPRHAPSAHIACGLLSPGS